MDNSQKKVSTETVKNYFHTRESRLGYRILLKGTRHFGYYPKGKEDLSFAQAQRLMEKLLADKLGLSKNSKVLDAGCGEGIVATNLAQKNGFNILGIDLLESSIKKAKNTSKKLGLEHKTSFIVGDYSRIKHKENYFDGVYTMESLVHVKNYNKALEEFFKVLKPGGRLVLFEYTLTKKDKLNKSQKELWNKVIEGTGMWGLEQFSHGCFPDVLSKVGFNNVETEEVTERAMPMLKSFNKIARYPYKFISLIKQQRRFINALFSVEAYEDILKNKSWKYIIVTAEKPS